MYSDRNGSSGPDEELDAFHPGDLDGLTGGDGRAVRAPGGPGFTVGVDRAGGGGVIDLLGDAGAAAQQAVGVGRGDVGVGEMSGQGAHGGGSGNGDAGKDQQLCGKAQAAVGGKDGDECAGGEPDGHEGHCGGFEEYRQRDYTQPNPNHGIQHRGILLSAPVWTHPRDKAFFFFYIILQEQSSVNARCFRQGRFFYVPLCHKTW